MNDLVYSCPWCEVETTVHAELIGQTVQCPHCNELFVATPPLPPAEPEFLSKDKTQVAADLSPRTLAFPNQQVYYPPEKTKKSKKKAQRITLTKGESESASGRKLLECISQLAADRMIDSSELKKFREQLNDPELQELAAVKWLKDNLNEVLADGYVTREEYYDAVNAILRVLPLPIREDWERRMRSGDRPATDRQVEFVKDLGGQVTADMTVKQASALIDSLLAARGQSTEDFR